ncbi:MAG TPA: hypothetical protein VHO84_06525 [Syntrophorhabdaceae bacterium]|nr:hypothetical protein [Syntrophorhabdaceae bacterium]
MKVLVIMLCGLMAACVSITSDSTRFAFDGKDTRHIRLYIGSDGSYSEAAIENLVHQFNGEAARETGLTLDIVGMTRYVPESMSRLCICVDWSNYLWSEREVYDIAVLFINDDLPGAIVRSVIPFSAALSWIGLIDAGVYQYIVLKGTDYWNFKHHIYHAFHPEHGVGIMSPIRSIEILPYLGIPVISTLLSQASRKVILQNKWRPFRSHDNYVHWKVIQNLLESGDDTEKVAQPAETTTQPQIRTRRL